MDGKATLGHDNAKNVTLGALFLNSFRPSRRPPFPNRDSDVRATRRTGIASDRMGPMTSFPTRQIRALYDEETIVVYQAYRAEIADAAFAAGKFTEPFSVTRMTWIKPSFLWMMYRSGWATKPGQERVLEIRITRAGFEEALAQACLASFEEQVHGSHEQWRAELRSSPVRVQWDPERTPTGAPLPWRSLQVGLPAAVVPSYVNDWIVSLRDITDLCAQRRAESAPLPVEAEYPVPRPIVQRLGM